MGFLKKTWVDRISEYPARRRLKKSDGTEEVVTVSREEGTISKEGDAFSAQNMNDLETRVSDAFDEVNNSLSKYTTGDCVTLARNIYLPNGDTWVNYTLNTSLSKFKFIAIGFGIENRSVPTVLIPISLFKRTTASVPLDVAPNYLDANYSYAMACYVNDTTISIYRSSKAIQWLRFYVYGIN